MTSLPPFTSGADARPTARRHALMLVNPNARDGDARLDEAFAVFARGGIDVTIEQFSSRAEVSPDIVRRKDRIDIVVVCGGDGTVNAAAQALVATGLPLGILPMGTANDLARTLSIPLALRDAAAVIVAGHQRKIDVGEVNGHLFFNVASLGLSSDLARGLSKETKRRWGRLGYALAGAKALLSARPFHATIVMKADEVRVKTLQIAVGNGRHYGGGSVVEASAAIDDAHLDLYSLEVSSVWKLALMFPDFRRGLHGAWSEVRTARCTEFEIRTRKPRPINTDGDLVTFTPAHFSIRPASIAVLAPEIEPPSSPSPRSRAKLDAET